MKRLLILLLLLAIPCSGYAFRAVNLLKILPATQPLGVSFDEAGHIYILQQNGGVRVLNPDGEALLTLGGTAPDGKPILGSPSGVAVLGERIYITDAKFHRIAVYNIDGKFQEFIGKEGDEAKEFDTPAGIVALRGELFVADTENERIQRLGPNGVYISSFGNKGAGDALLNEPTALSIDSSGRLLVLDDERDIKIFTPTGDYLGKLPIGDRTPIALAADGEGIYVADEDRLQISKLDQKGKEIFSFGTKGKDRSQFQSINGIAAAKNGRILVADNKKNEVHILTIEQTSVTTSPSLSDFTTVRAGSALRSTPITNVVTSDGLLYAIGKEPDPSILIFSLAKEKQEKAFKIPKVKPNALAITPNKTIWLVDRGQEKLLKVGEKGEVLATIGSSGSKDGSFDSPSDIAISSAGLIYVADSGNGRIQIFNSEGTFLNSIGGKKDPSLFKSPEKIEFDLSGNLYILDRKTKQISLLDPAGKRILAFGGEGEALGQLKDPTDFTLTQNEIFVLDAGHNTVKVYTPKGKFLRQFACFGTARGDLNAPEGITAIDDTTLIVADTGNSRLQTFNQIYTPEAPARLNAVAGPRQVNLLWEKTPESYISGYNLYRSSKKDGPFEKIASQSANSFLDREVEPGKVYHYCVVSVAKGGNESDPTKTVEATPTKVTPLALQEVKTNLQEWSIDLTWTPTDAASTVEYRVYQLDKGKSILLGATKETIFTAGNLDPNTPYTFEVAAVSLDEMESPRLQVEATTLVTTKAPIELEFSSLSDVYTNTYKIYETDKIGTLKIFNNTSAKISKIKVTFAIKDYMDFPSEVEISDIAPRSSQEIPLKAVFNNLLLNLTEDTAVQAELVATYYKNQEQSRFSKSQTIKLFEKHRMSWTEKERFSAFVTPKDPVILEFSRSIATQFSELADPILFAGVSFDALGLLGIGYLQDPSNPYQVTSGKTDYVDYIQYPRETMSRKSGDCDDLVGLYSSILESLGIQTKVVEVPGHMFMIFAVPVNKETIPANFRDMYVEHDGGMWIPVEVTQIGSPFMKAWESGVRNYDQWKENGLSLMDTRAAWGKFKPASLPMTEWRPQAVNATDINNKFKEELITLRKIRLQNLGQAYLARLKKDPNDIAALMQLGIVYAKNQEPGEAIPAFEKARKLAPNNASVHNNLANCYFQTERYDDAVTSYSESIRIEGSDPYVWVNLARVQLRLNKTKEAIESFAKAIEINPTIRDEFKTLAITLDTPF